MMELSDFGILNGILLPKMFSVLKMKRRVVVNLHIFAALLKSVNRLPFLWMYSNNSSNNSEMPIRLLRCPRLLLTNLVVIIIIILLVAVDQALPLLLRLEVKLY